MTKTLDIITEIIRNTKHPFRKADDRPVKAQKRRYERRKIREFIRLGDWAQEQQDGSLARARDQHPKAIKHIKKKSAG